MGQTFSTAALSAASTGIQVPELSDLTYEKSLGTARFMKCVRARHQHGLVVVKLVAKPFPQLDLTPYVRAIRQQRDALADVPNALGYQKILETSTNGYLIRQYLYSSLYDRLSTRPFLEDIERKWLAFQLLCGLRDCHARNVYHGDIKTENILVTSWNWLYITDFSSSYKMTYLPEDNPADFSYYFDTSGRRTCYIAPERFLAAGNRDDGRGITWAMDIFSAGCVIAELFLESPIFNLSQLYKYRRGEFDPHLIYLSKIQDPEIRELITCMIKLEPGSRYSAEDCLSIYRQKVFPEYFDSFLHQYMGTITDPSSGRTPVMPDTDNFGEGDDRIDRIYFDFDKISYFLGYEDAKNGQAPENSTEKPSGEVIPVEIDIPNNRHQATALGRHPVDDGSLIFLTLVVSSLRSTARSTARIRACDLMLAFAERLTDEAKLDRVLPYVVIMLSDRADIVKVAALRTMTQLLSLIAVVSPVNANVFTEYIRPRLQQFVQGPGPKAKPFVRAAYASCLATLAHASARILDVVQALRVDGSIPTNDPEAEDGLAPSSAYRSLFDVARQELTDHFVIHTKALLTDSDPSVRRAFLGSVSSLCVFFGNSMANDVVLSHLNTYLNDKDWMLRCTFFHTIVGVATFVGGTSLEEFILPLMIQSLTDPEEFVVEKVLSSFASMAELGLLQRATVWEMIDVVSRFMIHPNIWIREAAAHFISSSTRYLSTADTQCIISPLIRPYLKTPIIDFRETNMLDSLKKPLPRVVYDAAVIWAKRNQSSLFWKPAQHLKTFSFGSSEYTVPTISSRDLRPNAFYRLPKNDEDEQSITRLRQLGMTPDDEFKLLALREYIWRMTRKAARESNEPSRLNNIVRLKEIGVTPQTVFFEKHKRKRSVRRRRSQGEQSSSSRAKATSPNAPLTIADALLDASTTINEPLAHRKKYAANTRKERTNASPGRPTEAGMRRDSSKPSSPLFSSPGGPHKAKDLSHLTTNSDSRRSSGLRIPHPRADNSHSDGTLTPTDSLKNGSDRGHGLKHRSSAMNLLNRKDASKTAAETSTTSANAFGKVDGPFVTDSTRATSNAETNVVSNKTVTATQIRAGHTYDGNDPSVLKLLDSLASENFALEMADFGPLVTPISRRHHVQKRTDGQEVIKPWRPDGVLVATFGEHKGAINRVIAAPDHKFFITGSDDGTVKVWDTSRLERNLAHRSRLTHMQGENAQIKCLTFVENTHTFASCATDGSIHVVKVDCTQTGDVNKYGRLRLVRQYQLPDGEYAVWLEHFKAEAHSVLLLATNTSRVIALDLRNMTVLYSFENPVHHGTPTCFCVDSIRHAWVLLGTSHGVLDLWDLRFHLRLKAWGLSGGTPIHRIIINPFHGRGRWVNIAGGTGQPEMTVWDLEKAQCKEVFRADTGRSSKDSLKLYEPWKVDEEKAEGMLGRFATAVEPTATGSGHSSPDGGIRAMAAGVDGPDDGREAKFGCFLTGGFDRKLRFWDMARAEQSMILSGLEVGEDQPTYSTSHPSTTLTIHTEKWSEAHGVEKQTVRKTKDEGKKSKSKAPRSTVISAQQRALLKSHLDEIRDVCLLERPVGMTVSVDRKGLIYVFQ